jgi:hypothetical protein
VKRQKYKLKLQASKSKDILRLQGRRVLAKFKEKKARSDGKSAKLHQGIIRKI